MHYALLSFIMARVDIKELETRYAHFGLYTTSAGSTELIVVRRKMGEPTDYMHWNARKVRRQRVNFALASQHWSHLTPTQKGYYRRQMDFVEVVGSPSKEKLLKGRQLFISREIRELNVAQKQLVTPFEVCIILCDEAYNPLKGEMWLFWKPSEEGEWKWIEGDELIKGNFLFRNVEPGQFVYHPYGESEGYYDPEEPFTFMTQDELRQYHYHILLDQYYRLILKEPWTPYEYPPEFELVLAEPWTIEAPLFPDLELVLAEPWLTPLLFELVLAEPWTAEKPPMPDLTLVITEPWNPPPSFELVLAEPWTAEKPPMPGFTQVISEPWNSTLLYKQVTEFWINPSGTFNAGRDVTNFKHLGDAWADCHGGAGNFYTGGSNRRTVRAYPRRTGTDPDYLYHCTITRNAGWFNLGLAAGSAIMAANLKFITYNPQQGLAADIDFVSANGLAYPPSMATYQPLLPATIVVAMAAAGERGPNKSYTKPWASDKLYLILPNATTVVGLRLACNVVDSCPGLGDYQWQINPAMQLEVWYYPPLG